MADLSLLNETFNLYYNKAKECTGKGDNALAKRYYMLAAEQMLKMAKESEGELQKARYSRAKSILEFAEGITAQRRKATDSDERAASVNIQRNDKISRFRASISSKGLRASKVRSAIGSIRSKSFRCARSAECPFPICPIISYSRGIPERERRR